MGIETDGAEWYRRQIDEILLKNQAQTPQELAYLVQRRAKGANIPYDDNVRQTLVDYLAHLVSGGVVALFGQVCTMGPVRWGLYDGARSSLVISEDRRVRPTFYTLATFAGRGKV